MGLTNRRKPSGEEGQGSEDGSGRKLRAAFHNHIFGETFPKELCIKGLVPSLWWNWTVVEPLRGGICGRKLGHLGCALVGDI